MHQGQHCLLAAKISLLQELWERIVPILADQALNALVSTFITAICSAVITLWAWLLSWTTTSSEQDQEANFTWDDIANQLEVPLEDSSTAEEPKVLSKGLDCSRVVKKRN